MCIGNQLYVPWKFPTSTPDPGTLCTPCNNLVGDNNRENDISTSIIEYETTYIDSKVDDNSELHIFPESDTESIATEITLDSNKMISHLHMQ